MMDELNFISNCLLHLIVQINVYSSSTWKMTSDTLKLLEN